MIAASQWDIVDINIVGGSLHDMLMFEWKIGDVGSNRNRDAHEDDLS